MKIATSGTIGESTDLIRGIEMAENQEKREAKPQEPSEGKNSTATLEKSAPGTKKPDQKSKNLPPFKVLLHNDDENSFDHVIRTLIELVHLPLREAVVKALEAHDTGVALILVTHLERAELLREQFTSKSLTATIEAA